MPSRDGPFYKGKHVAVVGGGNSGIEAAIDLAGICSKVTVLEFMDELKADQVLQEKQRACRMWKFSYIPNLWKWLVTVIR